MRLSGRLKLGFYPLPVREAAHIRTQLKYPEQFSAIDPCVGDGVAFKKLLESSQAHAYGIEIDAYRAEQAAQSGIEVIQANALTVRCPVESVSLLYLNPPYDFEIGQQGNKRLESVFLEHTYRWLKQKGVLVFVIPQAQLKVCARLLAEHFIDLRIYRLTEPESVQYGQIVVMASRQPRTVHLQDSELLQPAEYLRRMADQTEIEPLTDSTDAIYVVPPSGTATFVDQGIPLDKVEDLLPQSSAYRQVSRVLVRENSSIKGRPLTPLHGGHVSLLATVGMLNGVFGQGDEAYGVRRKPGLIRCAGKTILDLGRRVYHLEDFIPVAHIPDAWGDAWVDGILISNVKLITTIENEYPFLSYVEDAGGPLGLAARNEFVVFTSGFPTPALVSVLSRLNQVRSDLVFQHWGDADVGGLRIWWFLRQRLGRPIQFLRTTPEWVKSEAGKGGKRLSGLERAALRRLYGELGEITDSDAYTAREVINALLDHGRKIEQERF